MFDGFQNMFDAMRRIVTGYNPDKYPQDKGIKENLGQAEKEVQENKDRNNGVYVPVETGQMLPDFSNSILLGGVLVLIVLALKD